jgi:nucleoside-diphosphate-sugar epimerase
MRVAVTGAAGNIGRHVVSELLARGHTVSAMDRRPSPEDAGGIDEAAVTWHTGDALDGALLDQVVAGADALIHLAAIPSPLLGTPEEVFGTNTGATFAALEAAGRAGVRRVAFASSISLLGLPYGPPGLSPLYAPVDEAHPDIGNDPYALSKEVDEAIGAMMHRRHGFQVIGLRICATAPMDLHLARQAEIARDPAGLANELWAYLDVRDGARAFVLAVEREIPGFTVVNVMAPDTYSPLPTAELMARYHPTTTLRRPLVGREVPFDRTRSRELLGFEVTHRLSFPEETA